MHRNAIVFALFMAIGVVEGAYNRREKEQQRHRRKKERPPHRFFSAHQQQSGHNRRGKQWGIGNDGHAAFQLVRDFPDGPNFTQLLCFMFSSQNTTRALSLIFPTRQPRHVAEGALNLLKSVLAGFGMSLISFFAMPIAGFRTAGFPGLIAGGLAGTLYAALFSLMGMANGVWQMARGAIETPMAVRAARNGMLWDVSVEKWKRYYLKQEQDELESVRVGSSSPVKDDAYYRLLEVNPRATSAAVKRAYYKKAREVHPDKNPSEEAAEQFRQLHAAYLVLSDDEKRMAYDQWGPEKETGRQIPLFDPYVFFGILFHSALMDKYVGALTVASFTDQMLQLARVDAKPDQCIQALLQGGVNSPRARKRQVEIAMNLQERTKLYDIVSARKFKESCRTEAIQIAASGPFGNKYLVAIGSSLILEANQYLGFQSNFLIGVLGVLKKNARTYRSGFSIARETMDLFKAMIQMKNRGEQNPDVILPDVLDVAWAYNEKDIRKTLQGACMRLFADAGDEKNRTDRAHAVRILGETFVEVAMAQATKPNDELMSRVEIAYQVAAQQVRIDLTYIIVLTTVLISGKTEP